VKDLSTTTKINSDAIRNPSSVIKENIIHSHNHFQKVTKDILWLNFTLHSQNMLYSSIKQLELTLIHLTQQIVDLFDAIQCAIRGRVPLKLISPVALQNILRKVTLKLPENIDLITSTNLNNMHLYYELTTVFVVCKRSQY
jgi:hypothetical protein